MRLDWLLIHRLRLNRLLYGLLVSGLWLDRLNRRLDRLLDRRLNRLLIYRLSLLLNCRLNRRLDRLRLN